MNLPALAVPVDLADLDHPADLVVPEAPGVLEVLVNLPALADPADPVGLEDPGGLEDRDHLAALVDQLALVAQAVLVALVGSCQAQRSQVGRCSDLRLTPEAGHPGSLE